MNDPRKTPRPSIMSLADYLARNYLKADSNPDKNPKKRKRKHGTSGLVIADDDALGWENAVQERETDDIPLTGQCSASSPYDHKG